ncbi:hypothetical protein J7K43_02350 [Candidatus Calescamantes bacterium]|nr:hypothetical protein [Candidatus Calescamantes bacterium]
MDTQEEKKIKEALAYKERGYLDLSREILESIPRRHKNSFLYFHEGDLYMKIARRKKAEISPLEYKTLLEKARNAFRKCIRTDRGEFYRFRDKSGNINYYTLRELAKERIKIIDAEILNLKGIKHKEELHRVAPLTWSEGTLLVVNPLRKKKL